MKDLDLNLKIIKSQEEDDINDFINNTASELTDIIDLESNLKSFLEKNGIQLAGEKQEFYALIVLSCILSDIGTQMSPYERNRNISKVKSISNKRNLNYNLLVSLTSYSQDIISIINSYLVNK